MIPPLFFIFICFSLVLSDEIVMVCWLRKVIYRKSSIKPPPPPFQRRKVDKPPPPLSIKPPLPLPFILILHKQLTWTDQLWFIQAGNSHCFWSSAAWPPSSRNLAPVDHFARLNKPFSLPFPYPSLLSPPPPQKKVLEKNKSLMGLNRGFTVSDIRLKNLLEN